MGELTVPKHGPPVLKLVLATTTVPELVLRKVVHGEHLFLPTFAEVSIKGEEICIEAKLYDPMEGWIRHWLDSDDPSLPTLQLRFGKDDILGLRIGGSWTSDLRTGESRHAGYVRYPTAVLDIRDPLGVKERWSLTFASTDANNAAYWIAAFAKMMREDLGIPVEESSSEGDIPL